MKLLLTNDDGIFADGLKVLYQVLQPYHEITVVAPDQERSAVGHGITLHSPLRCRPVGFHNGMLGYAVSGLPADCIKLGISEILKHPPDMVISGINPGANVGVNVNYSGTVAAAKEAALYGIPAIAVSIKAGENIHYSDAARFISRLVETIVRKGLDRHTFLNVNFPNLPFDRTRGIKLSRQGLELFSESFEKRLDPRNQAYYWQGGDNFSAHLNSDTDSAAIDQGFISITPIKCDMTDYEGLKSLKQWGLEREL